MRRSRLPGRRSHNVSESKSSKREQKITDDALFQENERAKTQDSLQSKASLPQDAFDDFDNDSSEDLEPSLDDYNTVTCIE